MIKQSRVRKSLNAQISQLNEVIAELDGLLTDIESEFYRVTIFGSARIDTQSPLYKQVYDLAYALGKQGVDVVTGAGPGLMEAANKGAKDGGLRSRSIGLSIQLPFEENSNMHLDIKRQHKRFSSRLDEFMRLSHAVVVAPGGIGTTLELFYTWQLLQVGHIKPRPIILWGKDMWSGLVEWMRNATMDTGYISPPDLDMVQVVDSLDEVMAVLNPKIAAYRAEAAQNSPKGLPEGSQKD